VDGQRLWRSSRQISRVATPCSGAWDEARCIRVCMYFRVVSHRYTLQLTTATRLSLAFLSTAVQTSTLKRGFDFNSFSLCLYTYTLWMDCIGLLGLLTVWVYVLDTLWLRRRRRRKKTGAVDSLFARLNNTLLCLL